MTPFPRLSERKEQLNIPAIKKELEELETALQNQYVVTSNKMINALQEETGMNEDDFVFNPMKNCFYLSDHLERRLHDCTCLCIDLNRSSDTQMGTSIKGIQFETRDYIQDVKPKEQNLILCAETLEMFAELMRALDNEFFAPKFIEISNEYWAYMISTASKRQKLIDALIEYDRHIQAASYVEKNLIPNGISTMEDLKEYLESHDRTQLQTILEGMHIFDSMMKNSVLLLSKKEKIIFIMKYACQPNDVEDETNEEEKE